MIVFEFAPDSNHIKFCVDVAIEKTDKYLKLTRKSLAWSISVVVHPRWKWGIFNSLWNTGENRKKLLELKKDVKAFWKENYFKTPANEESTEPPAKRKRFDYGAFSSVVHDSEPFRDEYDRYVADRPDDVDDPIQWWKDRRHTYPQLSQLAFDMLAIPAMSTECERTFSKAGYSISPRRSQLGPDILEAAECLKLWITNGLVKDASIMNIMGS